MHKLNGCMTMRKRGDDWDDDFVFKYFWLTDDKLLFKQRRGSRETEGSFELSSIKNTSLSVMRHNRSFEVVMRDGTCFVFRTSYFSQTLRWLWGLDQCRTCLGDSRLARDRLMNSNPGCIWKNSGGWLKQVGRLFVVNVLGPCDTMRQRFILSPLK